MIRDRKIVLHDEQVVFVSAWNYANTLRDDLREATLDDLREAVEILESVARLWTRVFGEAHPETPRVQGALVHTQEKLAARAAASSSGAA